MEDVKRLSQNNYISPEIKKHARLAAESYRFPVESMVALPNGTVIHRINANKLLDNDHTDTSSIFGDIQDGISGQYYVFLNEAISKSKVYLEG